jgi:hypothetical protein
LAPRKLHRRGGFCNWILSNKFSALKTASIYRETHILQEERRGRLWSFGTLIFVAAVFVSASPFVVFLLTDAVSLAEKWHFAKNNASWESGK